jgi:glycine/D-amino acid oxidase-like deaminating enzyme
LAAEVGAGLELTMRGGLMVAETVEQEERLHRKHALERQLGIPTTVVGGDLARARWPGLGQDVRAASLCPMEGHANPLRVTTTLVKAAQKRGVQFVSDCAVCSVDADADGYLVRSANDTWHARTVVIAAGVGSGTLTRSLGWQLAVRVAALQVAVLSPAAPCLPVTIQHVGAKLSLKQMASGHVIVGGGWSAQPVAGARPPSVRYDSLLANLAVAVRVWPQLVTHSLLRVWTGETLATEDGLPTIAVNCSYPGVYCVFGGNGFTLAPAIADWLANELAESQLASL